MIEDRTMVRERLSYGPDGNSVRTTERVEVQIRWPGGGEPKEQDHYETAGEWRLLPAPLPSTIDITERSPIGITERSS